MREEDSGLRRVLAGRLAIIQGQMEGSYLSDFAFSLWLYCDALSSVSLLQGHHRYLAHRLIFMFPTVSLGQISKSFNLGSEGVALSLQYLS